MNVFQVQINHYVVPTAQEPAISKSGCTNGGRAHLAETHSVVLFLWGINGSMGFKRAQEGDRW